MTKTRSRAYTIGRKTYYLDEEIYRNLLRMKISKEELEREYFNMQQATPGIKVTYNVAAYSILYRRLGGRI